MANGKYTLLEVVQQTLEALGSDEVNSISDSVEAEQIASMAERAYYELLNMSDWPFLHQLTELESVADSTLPNFLRIPEAVVNITQVKYDWTDTVATPTENLDIEEVEWVHPQRFLDITQSRNSLLTNVQQVTSPNGVTIPIYNNQKANYWTSFDDIYVVFDAFDNTIDSTLQGNKTQVIAKVIPSFSKTDSFTPTASPQFFQTWISEVIRSAFVYIRQEVSTVDEIKARRGLAVLRRDKSRTNQSDGKVKFGRPARSGGLNGIYNSRNSRSYY